MTSNIHHFEGVQGAERKRAATEILRIQESFSPNAAGAQ